MDTQVSLSRFSLTRNIEELWSSGGRYDGILGIHAGIEVLKVRVGEALFFVFGSISRGVPLDIFLLRHFILRQLLSRYTSGAKTLNLF
jgi:hypothetical protein